MKNFLIAFIAAATVVVVMGISSVTSAGPPVYRPHLGFVGFDTLGEPSTGLNSEVVVDGAAKFVYVGALFGDNDVKAVDVSDPTNPVLTDSQAVLGGDLGPFDVKIVGDILAASTQGTVSSNAGITLMDITNRADPVPVAHLGPGDIKSPDGSHNSFLWADPVTDTTWLFGCGLDDTSLMLFDVTDPSSPVFVAEYDNGNPSPFVHDCFTQENGDRIIHYQAGSIGVEILDVTRVVRGGQLGPFTSPDVVGFNRYTSDAVDAETVTRPGFAHYIEPTADGAVAWVGDEAGCGEPAIVRSLDASSLPEPPTGAGNPAKFLSELGTIIDNPDPKAQCRAVIVTADNDAADPNPQLHNFRFTGHNFDIVHEDGVDLMFRGDYGRGVSVFDVSDPTNPLKVAKSRGLNRGTGAENKADPGRDKSLENPTFIWGAVYDGDFIYASDLNQGLYILELIEN